MREIKFRAWANGKMYSFENKKWLTFSSSGLISFQDTLEGSFDEDSDNCMSEDFHLMQFTGLKDNTTWDELTEKEREEWVADGNMPSEWNGKEIYEGDICKFTNHPHTAKVIYWENQFAFESETPELTKNNPLTLMYFEDCKVIGNIHENKNLLK